MLASLGKSLLSGRKKKKSKSGKEMSEQILNRSENVEEDKNPVIKPQNSLVPLSLKTTTIPTANLITTKEDSVKDKLLMIKDLLGLQLKFRLSSLSQRMKSMMEERRKKREKELEENKEKKKKSSFLNILPKIGILDSLKNFLAFLAGGFLLNLLLNNFDVLEGIGNTILSITKGIMQVGKFLLDGVIGFITTAYDGYDALRESVRDIGGDEAVEKFDKLSDLLKIVINGAIMAATLALVTSPLRRGGGFGRGGGAGGLTRVGGARGVKPSAVTRYTQRFGRNAAVKKFGETAVQRYGSTAQNLGPLQKIGNIFRRGSNVTRNVPKVGFMEGMGTQFKKIGEFLNPKNLKNINLKNLKPSGAAFKKIGEFLNPKNLTNINLKNLRPSGAAVRGVATGVAKGAGTFVAGAVIDGIVDLTFSQVDKKIGRDGVKNLVKKFGVEKSVNMIEKRLVEEDNKPVAPWWMLGLGDGEGTGVTQFRDQKFINNEAYKLKYLTEEFLKESDKESDKLSGNIFKSGKDKKGGVFEVSSSTSSSAVDFMKNIAPVGDIAQDTPYSQGSYGLISDITTLIQPIIQEV